MRGGEWGLEGRRKPDPILPWDPHQVVEGSGWKGAAVVMAALPTLTPLRLEVGGGARLQLRGQARSPFLFQPTPGRGKCLRGDSFPSSSLP